MLGSPQLRLFHLFAGVACLFVCVRSLAIDAASTTREIDRAALEVWDTLEIKPASLCDDMRYLRRVTLHLAGRIPNLDEIDESHASDSTALKPEARARIVESLIESEDYAQNFAWLWGEALAGEDVGKDQVLGRDSLTTWLEGSFRENLPMDVLVREMLTSKGSLSENPSTGFFLRHDFNRANLAGKTAQVFLGKSIQCAQCHDHPYDKTLKQKDFWGMAAYFGQLRKRVIQEPNQKDREIRTYDGALSRIIIPDSSPAVSVVPKPLGGAAEPVRKGIVYRESLTRWLTSPDNADFARAIVNRTWAHFMGRGFIEPVDDMGSDSPCLQPEVLDILTRDFIASGYDYRFLIRTITASRAYQLDSIAPAGNAPDDDLFAWFKPRPEPPYVFLRSFTEVSGLSPEQMKPASYGAASTQAGIRRFVSSFGTMENESGEYEGTIPQALALLNGPAFNSFEGPRRTSLLRRILDESADTKERIRRIYLGILTREPTEQELKTSVAYVESLGIRKKVSAWHDLAWALCASSEFAQIH